MLYLQTPPPPLISTDSPTVSIRYVQGTVNCSTVRAPFYTQLASRESHHHQHTTLHRRPLCVTHVWWLLFVSSAAPESHALSCSRRDRPGHVGRMPGVPSPSFAFRHKCSMLRADHESRTQSAAALETNKRLAYVRGGGGGSGG